MSLFSFGWLNYFHINIIWSIRSSNNEIDCMSEFSVIKASSDFKIFLKYKVFTFSPQFSASPLTSDYWVYMYICVVWLVTECFSRPSKFSILDKYHLLNQIDPSQVFPQHTLSDGYVHGLLDFQEYVRVLQSPMSQSTSIPSLSFQTFG